MMTITLLLFACTGKDDGSGDTGDAFVAPPAEPWVSIVAATEPGYMRSDCAVGLTLYTADTHDEVASSTIGAQGREWTGVPIEPGVLSTATAEWANCVNTSAGTGSFESGNFSADEGQLFVFRYDGVTTQFNTLVQGEDFVGGTALVTFRDEATTDDVAAYATEHGVTATATGDADEEYQLNWTDTTSVAEVLSAFTAENLYLEGQPSWIRVPDWW